VTAKPARTRNARAATLLELVRGGYGALQLAAPGMVARALLNRRLDTRARTLSRVLGARQLAQALASGGSPSCPVLALGVEVDLLHGGSMVALGIAESAPECGAARCADCRLVRMGRHPRRRPGE
jgi:hypothetical protein